MLAGDEIMKSCEILAMLLLGTAISAFGSEVKVEKISGRTLQVTCQENGQTYQGKFEFPIGQIFQVTDEHHSKIKPYIKGGAWSMTSPNKLRSMECNTPCSYLPGTLVVKSGKGADAAVYQQGKDYEIDDEQSVFGRLPGGAIKEDTAVYISYKYITQRIDAVVLRDGKLLLINGVAKVNCPQKPELQSGDKLLLTVWVYGSGENLADNAVMIIDEEKMKTPDVSDVAAKLLPRTLQKLQNGEKIRILAWGDSITNGGYLPVEKRWTSFFINGLRKRYPQSEIEFLTSARTPRTSSSIPMT